MEIAVTSFRVTTRRCGHTEAGFTKITSPVLSWIKTTLLHRKAIEYKFDKVTNSNIINKEMQEFH